MRCVYLTAAVLIFLLVDAAAAQQGIRRPPGRPPGQGGPNNQGNQGKGAEEFKLPEDPKLVEIHRNFVIAAEKLAADYERTNQTDKARACYTEILRLVPTYTVAAEKLGKIKEKEATAEKKLFDVFANKGWQDAGITVIAGKPLSLKAQGQWTLKMNFDLTPDGIEIPEELRDYPLGSLIGTISESPNLQDAKPFLVGGEKVWEPKESGRLYLRIYDSDTSDNVGRVGVIIEGTYNK